MMTETEKRQLFGEPRRARVRLADIRRENGAQMREALSPEAVRDYADAYRERQEMPPISVFLDGGTLHLDGDTLRPQGGILRLADGFQRWAGGERAGLEELEADVYLGDLRLCKLFAAQANGDHGVRRSDETVRRSINTLLADAEWRTWSDRAIGRHVGCSHTTVARYRGVLEAAEAAAAGKGQQQGLFDEPTDTPPPPKVRKGADGRAINVSKIGKGAEEERIKKAIAEAERLGTIEAADSRPSSRRDLVRAIKQTIGVDVPDHAQADLHKTYLAARDREIEKRQRAAELAAAAKPEAEPEEPAQTYQPILGGAEGKALQDRPLATPAIGDLIRQEAQRLEATYQPRIAELEAEVNESKRLMQQANETLLKLEDCYYRAEGERDAARELADKYAACAKAAEPRIAELERDLRNAEVRLRKEQDVNTALLTAITRTAALWRGEHDGPRAQLLSLLEEQGQQDAAAQWDRALQRAAELGRQESAARVEVLEVELREAARALGVEYAYGGAVSGRVQRLARALRRIADQDELPAVGSVPVLTEVGEDLQRQLGAAKEDARLLRQQVQELEQDAAARRQRSRQVLCEEPDCGRYTEAPQGGGLALCEAHRPDAAPRLWTEVYILGGCTRANRLSEMDPKTWQELGTALVRSHALPQEIVGVDPESFAAGSLEQVTDADEIDLGELRPRERAALLQGVSEALAQLPPAPAPPAKGRKARAPKAEPAPAPQHPEPAAAPTWLPASIGGAKAVHAVEAAAEKSGEVEGFQAALCGQRPDGKGWTRRYNNPTCKGCQRATQAAPAEPRGNLTQEQRRALLYSLLRPSFSSGKEPEPTGQLAHELARHPDSAWAPLCQGGATDDEIAEQIRRLWSTAIEAHWFAQWEVPRDIVHFTAMVGIDGQLECPLFLVQQVRLERPALVKKTRQMLQIPERQAQEVSRG